MKRIDILPDDVLLEVFDFYANMYPFHGVKTHVEAWQSLVHVCRRWRSLVLGSPRRLNLRLYCTPETPVKDKLDVWPALPLVIGGSTAITPGTENIIAAIGQSNRVRQVELHLAGQRQLEEVLAAMQVPFPELTRMHLSSNNETPPAIPDSFLGGSAPRLQYLKLDYISFPGFPKLLLSATHLVYLLLINIPHHSWHMSPEAMVDLLSMLSSLRGLSLEFLSAQTRPDWESRNLPPLKRSILPALDKFCFDGTTQYLEELVTRIDTPQLDQMHITFLNQIYFDCPFLVQFINRTPTLSRACNETHVQFFDSAASVILRDRTSEIGSDHLPIEISWIVSIRQLSCIELFCNSSLHPLSTVQDLYIENHYWKQVWSNHVIENTQWLQLLLPFTAVKNLYLSRVFVLGIAAALQKLIGGRMTEVLPSLQNIFVEEVRPWGLINDFKDDVGQFIEARRLSDHPITISVWDKDSDSDM